MLKKIKTSTVVVFLSISSNSMGYTQFGSTILARDIDCDGVINSLDLDWLIIADETVVSLEIVFGEKIQLPELDNSVSWTINGPSGTVSGTGNALNKYVYDKPGKYEISLIDNSAVAITHSNEESCKHEKFPSKINITVFPVKMTFLGEELKISADVHKGMETTGISISIPVIIETYGNQNLNFNYTTINTAGVGTNIRATLKEGTTLKQGKQILEYELSGIAECEAYIMFDFLDINGKVQSVALKTLIK